MALMERAGAENYIGMGELSNSERKVVQTSRCFRRRRMNINS